MSLAVDQEINHVIFTSSIWYGLCHLISTLYRTYWTVNILVQLVVVVSLLFGTSIYFFNCCIDSYISFVCYRFPHPCALSLSLSHAISCSCTLSPSFPWLPPILFPIAPSLPPHTYYVSTVFTQYTVISSILSSSLPHLLLLSTPSASPPSPPPLILLLPLLSLFLVRTTSTIWIVDTSAECRQTSAPDQDFKPCFLCPCVHSISFLSSF